MPLTSTRASTGCNRVYSGQHRDTVGINWHWTWVSVDRNKYYLQKQGVPNVHSDLKMLISLSNHLFVRAFPITYFGREFIRIAGNSNFNCLLDVFVSISGPNIYTRVFPPFFWRRCVCWSFPEFLCFFSWSFRHDIVYARAQAAILRFYTGYCVKEVA